MGSAKPVVFSQGEMNLPFFCVTKKLGLKPRPSRAALCYTAYRVVNIVEGQPDTVSAVVEPRHKNPLPLARLEGGFYSANYVQLSEKPSS
jgi:hypothetical protein